MLIAISSNNKRIKKTVYYSRDDTNIRTAYNIKQFDNIQYQYFTSTRARWKAISYTCTDYLFQYQLTLAVADPLIVLETFRF